MCKYWGELMGMAGGHVRMPLTDLTDEEKKELAEDISSVKSS
jgi:dihydrodipicolinate synthase/N-acetylneuraminate lyase